MAKILELSKTVKSDTDYFHVGDHVRIKSFARLKVTGIITKIIGNSSVWVKWPSGTIQAEFNNTLIKVKE